MPIDDVGKLEDEEPFPIWAGNPFINKIVNADDLGVSIVDAISAAHEQHCHFAHVIENICAEHGVVPRSRRPSLFLSEEECRQALRLLSDLPRPILCVHPYGTSSPGEGHPWHREEWLKLIAEVSDRMSVLEVGLHRRGDKGLPTRRFRTTLRQMMAIVWASDMFVGFDSSVAHVATAFAKPAVVLWEPIGKTEIDRDVQLGLGAAAYARWSYPENRNLILLDDTQGDVRRATLDWIESHRCAIGPFSPR
ncbi:glycosyltransferase family 9 protein [Notoacmeibacter marinus]|uniref:glycosyltransferase family 9 protein n=1 Tax=Notoacmeibacter marinus TaxID=1876515 RepID=UPI0013B06648|nr:glycosyltransferase family 9 protein [Notoacmeibacter marinus]